MLLFKTFIFQMAPKSRKLSYWSASQGVDLEWNQFRESSPGVLSRILKHNVSEKLANSQHVFLLHDYNWVCEWCSRLLSGLLKDSPPIPPHACLLPAFLCWCINLHSDLAQHSSGLPRFLAAKTRVRGWNIFECSCERNSTSGFGSLSNSCSISFSSVKQFYLHRKI